MYIQVPCRICEKTFNLSVDFTDFNNWLNKGVMIQDAMPYLTTDQRELLISHTCGRCYDNLYGSIENYE